MNDARLPQPARVAGRDLAAMTLSDAIDAFMPEYTAALPDNIPPERFKRVLITALNQNPALTNCDRRSFFLASIKCAQDGLYPDGREAALVPLSGVVQYFPMVAGIRKRMRNSGEVLSAIAEVVYRNDHFRYVQGEEARIEHEPPPLPEERGEMIGAYAIIKLKNGETIREVMNRHEIERIRKLYSKTSRDDAPWNTQPGEMWRKTVLRRASKYAPISAEMEEMWPRESQGAVPRDPPSRPRRPMQAVVEAPMEDNSQDEAALYEVTNCDGETHSCTASTVGDNILAVFAEAQRRGMAAVEAAIENNEGTIKALSDDGEHAIARPLLIELAQLRGVVAQRGQNAELAESDEAGAEIPGGHIDAGDGAGSSSEFDEEIGEWTDDLPAPVQNPADSPPAHSPAVVSPDAPRAHGVSPTPPPGDADYIVKPILDRNGAITYRVWWAGAFLNRARRARSEDEITAVIAANGDLIQGYYKTLAPPALIAAKKELDDIQKALR